MFIGEYAHTIDDKGRISVPAKFREQLKEGIVVTRGLDHCLFVYPKKEWEVLAQKLAALPISSRQSRAFARLMLAGAWDVAPDSQGRIMLPEYLRQYAALDKHATIAGLYNRLEIWDEDSWHNYRSQTEAASDSIAESMAELGI
ncbi:MAG: division/cell wall cluster transcriptional repressor MraZ [bacterium]|nr:division/cell wall cluster transcriptional repressor MraZ [bacterium]MDZ4342312.1 division/cell wall cluster transcriptional repressor MraZ [Candidatus Binatia bacterium]